jgi:integrase
MNKISPTALIVNAELGATLTLSWVISQIDGAEHVPSRRRRDWLSALRSFCRIVGKRPDQVPAATQAIRTHLAHVTPASAGVSPKRLQNIKADLLAALRHSGITKFSLTPDFVPMSLAWERLWSQIQNQQVRFKLSRLFRFASARQIQPDQLTDALLRDLLLILATDSLTRDPAGHVRGTIWAWNRCARECAGWPQITLQKLVTERRGWASPLEEFPVGFRSDLDAWITRLKGDDLLAEDGPLRPLAPATLNHRKDQARTIASAAVRAGVPIERFQSLGPLADPEVLAKATQWLIDRAGGQRTESMAGIVAAMQGMARHYLKEPEDKLQKIARIHAKMGKRVRGMRARNRERLLALDDTRKLEALLMFPADQLARAKRAAPARKTAFQVQMAVAVEILQITAIRLKNLANLDIDRHFKWSKPGRRGTLHMIIEGSEVKNGALIMRELPAEAAQLIRTYIEIYHPLLTDQPTSCLFPGRNGRAKVQSCLSLQITRTLKTRIGIDMNPHLFRHFDGKVALDAQPDNYELVRRLLAHSSIDTTSQSYIGLESKAAGKIFDEIIQARRRRCRRRPR